MFCCTLFFFCCSIILCCSGGDWLLHYSHLNFLLYLHSVFCRNCNSCLSCLYSGHPSLFIYLCCLFIIAGIGKSFNRCPFWSKRCCNFLFLSHFYSHIRCWYLLDRSSDCNLAGRLFLSRLCCNHSASLFGFRLCHTFLCDGYYFRFAGFPCDFNSFCAFRIDGCF